MLVRQKPNLEQDLSAHRSFGKKLKSITAAFTGALWATQSL